MTVKELSALFPDVSLMTIHRDLEKLEQEGVISRTRGGAVSTVQGGSITEAKLEARMHTNMKAKREMAAKALTLVEQGSAVFLDAGTSSLALAQALPDMDVNIFTTGPNIALELGRLSMPAIHMCGGTLNRFNQAVSGQSTLQMLEHINIATAFVGVSGYTDEGGFHLWEGRRDAGQASDAAEGGAQGDPDGQLQVWQRFFRTPLGMWRMWITSSATENFRRS